MLLTNHNRWAAKIVWTCPATAQNVHLFIHITVTVLKFCTPFFSDKWQMQTVHTLIWQYLKEKPDQGLLCLPCHKVFCKTHPPPSLPPPPPPTTHTHTHKMAKKYGIKKSKFQDIYSSMSICTVWLVSLLYDIHALQNNSVDRVNKE